MKRLLPIAGLFVFVLAVFLANPAASDDNGAAGKKLFLDQKCNLCHSVPPAGIEAMTKSKAIKGPDLVNVGDRHDKEWVEKWLRLEETMNGKKHKKKFTGSDEELDTLVDWVLSHKS